MNISPVSFGRTVKIVGNSPLNSAVRSIQLVNGTGTPTANEQKSYEKLQRTFYDSGKGEMLQAISFDNNKTAYVLSGKEYQQLFSLMCEKHQQIFDAISIYGENSPMVQLVAEAEEDRYIDLAKTLVADTEDATLKIDFNKDTYKIKSVQYLA